MDRATHIRLLCHQCLMPSPLVPFLLFNLIPISTHQLRFFFTHGQTIPSHSHPLWKTCPLPPTAPCPVTPPRSFHQSAAVAPNHHSLFLPYPPFPPTSGNLPVPQAPPQGALTQAHAQAHSNLGTNGTSHSFLVTTLSPSQSLRESHFFYDSWIQTSMTTTFTHFKGCGINPLPVQCCGMVSNLTPSASNKG